MSSIFRKDDKFYDKPNRNNFDLSFQNNFTLNAGQLVPVLCKEVLPGDSFQIDPTFGIRAMPLVWPIQTRMKAYLHFYYVRNRNLWKDWPDFIGGTKQNLIPPYMYLTNENRDMVNTGEIGDYFGIPTVTYGEFGNNAWKSIDTNYYDFESNTYIDDYWQYWNIGSWEMQSSVFTDGSLAKVLGTEVSPTVWASHISPISDSSQYRLSGRLRFRRLGVNSENPTTINIWHLDSTGKVLLGARKTFNNVVIPAANTNNYIELEFGPVPTEAVYIFVTINIGALFNQTGSWSWKANSAGTVQVQFLEDTTVSFGIENKDLELTDLPFISDDNPNGLRISTMPFRALESVYNCIYRNAENNPLIGPDGQPEYNKWILNNDGGADTTHYKLHYRNWEDDFLTTALPSPQQGNAPLVGLTGTATINFASEDGTETVTATTDENGQITAINAGNSNLSDALSQMVDYGISINDFRNVNALQRWLENNIRRGYKYQDQIQTHYGVSVRYDELDMPEFIGGASQIFAVNQISQTVSSETQVLGDYAGQASCLGGGNQITHYCDEHGYIIGVLCISPVPNYSQLLPKHFLKNDKFDYFFPEFGHIGMQPIPLKEITPLQTYRQQKADGSVNLEDTFGYQRAWYEYLASTDEVHGLFRNQLRNFVMNRTFDDTPELGPEFTTIDPEQLNDVFAVQDTSHKFLGQVYFDIRAKRPIPLYGIPKLE